MIGLNIELLVRLAPKPKATTGQNRIEAARHAAAVWITAPSISHASAVPIGSWKRRLDRVIKARGTHWLNNGNRFRRRNVAADSGRIGASKLGALPNYRSLH
jgi:hypothetical protein